MLLFCDVIRFLFYLSSRFLHSRAIIYPIIYLFYQLFFSRLNFFTDCYLWINTFFYFFLLSRFSPPVAIIYSIIYSFYHLFIFPGLTLSFNLLLFCDVIRFLFYLSSRFLHALAIVYSIIYLFYHLSIFFWLNYFFSVIVIYCYFFSSHDSQTPSLLLVFLSIYFSIFGDYFFSTCYYFGIQHPLSFFLTAVWRITVRIIYE